MKTMTVTLTDEEADRIESKARDEGLSPGDLLHDAVVAYIAAIPVKTAEPGKRLGFIGIGASGYRRTSEEIERILAEATPDASSPSTSGHLWFIPESENIAATSDIASRFDEVLAETFTRFLLEEEVSCVPEDDSRDDAEPKDQTDDLLPE